MNRRPAELRARERAVGGVGGLDAGPEGGVEAAAGEVLQDLGRTPRCRPMVSRSPEAPKRELEKSIRKGFVHIPSVPLSPSRDLPLSMPFLDALQSETRWKPLLLQSSLWTGIRFHSVFQFPSRSTWELGSLLTSTDRRKARRLLSHLRPIVQGHRRASEERTSFSDGRLNERMLVFRASHWTSDFPSIESVG